MKYPLLAIILLSISQAACQLEAEKVQDAKSIPDIRQTAKQIDVDSADIAFITGHFDPKVHPDFIPIPTKYASREGMFLHHETLKAFIEMSEHAIRDSIKLIILSATRNFEAQKNIWEAKWMGKRLVEDGQNLALTTPDPVERALKILQFSSMPGTSRHHWGTDIDLNNLTNEYFSEGDGLRIYNWLSTHASTYGFCQPYSPKEPDRPNGYQEEKWHWSYLPLALPLTLKATVGLRDSAINGFLGSETAISIKIVENYVLGINAQCK